MSTEAPTVSTALDAFYARSLQTSSAIAPHLPRLRALADGLDLAVEFGVKRGASSSALLLGAQRVLSFDILATPEVSALQKAAGGRWDYRLQDSRTADIPECELLFIDSLHTYEQVRGELVHASRVRRYLVFHDVLTFGSVGADGESGRQLWTYSAGVSVPPAALGIRPAIDALMMRDPSWRIAASYTDSHGLLVLERRP